MSKSRIEDEPNARVNAPAAQLRLAKLPFDQPWSWLAAGWRDLWQQPLGSLAFGVIATLLGLLLVAVLAMAGLGALVPVLAGGFTLIGPLMAVGLYEKSRRIAAGEPPQVAAMLRTAFKAASRLGLFAAALLIIYLIWIRIAFLLLMLFLGTDGLPPPRDFMATLLFTSHGLWLLIVGTTVGAVLAVTVFTLSVVSIPLLMERRIDAFTAMATSVAVVAENPRAMALWAAIIAGFVALGFLTLGLGLVIIFPLIGHATWHAYRDAVLPSEL